MIDFKRVTPGFVFAYVKWAIPIIICFIVLIFSVNIMLGGITERNMTASQEAQEISKLNNRLATLQAATETTNSSAPVEVDEEKINADQKRLENFVNLYLNYDGAEQNEEVLKKIDSEFNPTRDTKYTPGAIAQLPATGKVVLGDWEGYCETVTGTATTWFCFFNLTIDDAPAQAYAEISVGDNAVTILSGSLT